MNVWVPETLATAIEKIVSAAASLTSDSPVRTESTRRRSPSWRPIATALTASGGATTAPRISAAPPVRPGTSSFPASPTASAVTTTSPTPSTRIGPSLRKNDETLNPTAAEYSSGGSTTPRMTSVSSSSRGTPGMNDAASATTVITSAGWAPLRSANALTAIAPTMTNTSCSPFIPGPSLWV